MNNSKKLQILLLIVIVMLVSGILAVKTPTGRRVIRHILARPARMLTGKTSFNSVNWKNSSIVYKSPYIRRQMVKDLMGHYQLVGMGRADVISLLGKPDGSLDSTSCWYFLNPDGWGDADILDVQFDASGNVNAAKISNN